MMQEVAWLVRVGRGPVDADDTELRGPRSA